MPVTRPFPAPDAAAAPEASASTDAVRHRRRKQARPQELLDAALALFVEKGFAATRIEEVAQRAGVSKGTLYLYYPGKEELLKAVFRAHLSERIAEGAVRAQGHGGSARALLEGPLVDWWVQLYDSPASGVFKLAVMEARNFPEIAQMYAAEIEQPATALLGGIIQRGMAQGEFRALDIENTVHSLVLPLVMACLHRHSVGACAAPQGLDGHAFIRHHIHLVLHGLLLPAAPASG